MSATEEETAVTEVQVWYSVPVAAHVNVETGEVTRVVVIDEMIRPHADLDGLKDDCEYDEEGDSSIDALIGYKDALEGYVYADGVTLPDFSGPAPADVATKARSIAESADWPSWENGY